jgi:hypothetical protein
MDAYPEDYLARNLPFVLISGLEPTAEHDSETDEVAEVAYPLLPEKGVQIYSDFPPLTGAIAEELRRALLEEDASKAPWDTNEEMHTTASGVEYRIRSIGRVSRILSLDLPASHVTPNKSSAIAQARFTNDAPPKPVPKTHQSTRRKLSFGTLLTPKSLTGYPHARLIPRLCPLP